MIKKLYATYVLAIFSLLYLTNPAELFSDMAVELEIDNAWNWRKIKRAFTR